MPRERKTIDEFDIEGNYGQGYEIVTCEVNRRLARRQVKIYRENEPGVPFKIVHRRRNKTDLSPEELAAIARDAAADWR